MTDPSLVRFRAVLVGALAHLESRRQEVNDLNVFPVADGDTGDNMVLTLGAVLDELDRVGGQDERSLDDIGREEIVERVARAALLGARGNSGVILSQLIRGAAEELVSRPGELVDPVLIGAAMARAADRAYGSVRAPAEGTILTVVREMASRIVTELAHHGADTRLVPGDEGTVQNALIADVLETALQTGEESVRRGPELLPALRDAGVVDAGGHAVTLVIAGVIAALRGSEPPVVQRRAPARISHPEHVSTTFRYCTNFAVTGEGLGSADFVPRLEALGDSVLVVGDASTLKVHVHTDDPEAATGVFAAVGQVSRLDVADMTTQVEQRNERLAGGASDDGGCAPRPTRRCGVLAVTSGSGMARLYESLGAHPLDGGLTLNPSTYELLAGIHAVPAEEVVVLPNSPNVIMAAERAAELSDKAVRVVPTRCQQAGLAACVAADPGSSAQANAAALAGALDHVRTGGIAPAARDDPQGRFRAGDAVGYVDDQLVVWGEPPHALAGVFEQLGEDAELLTCIAGDGAPLGDGAVRALAPRDVELEMSAGGQPSWWWLIAAE